MRESEQLAQLMRAIIQHRAKCIVVVENSTIYFGFPSYSLGFPLKEEKKRERRFEIGQTKKFCFQPFFWIDHCFWLFLLDGHQKDLSIIGVSKSIGFGVGYMNITVKPLPLTRPL